MIAWPFSDSPNTATFTVRQIVAGSQPVLLVVRDAEDGSWQFLTGGTLEMADALLVSLEAIVGADASLLELADLPIGWQASRDYPGDTWRRSPSTTDP